MIDYSYRNSKRTLPIYILAPSYDLAKAYFLNHAGRAQYFQFVTSIDVVRGISRVTPIFLLLGDRYSSFTFPSRLYDLHNRLFDEGYNLVYKTMEGPLWDYKTVSKKL